MSDNDPSELIDKYQAADELLGEIQKSFKTLSESEIVDEDVVAQYELLEQLVGMIRRREKYDYAARNVKQAAYYDNNY
jgi:hypothetical protein